MGNRLDGRLFLGKEDMWIPGVRKREKAHQR